VLHAMLRRLLGITAPVHALSWSADETTLISPSSP
jgi:hypothetical protein